jgi:hypothetical protein
VGEENKVLDWVLCHPRQRYKAHAPQLSSVIHRLPDIAGPVLVVTWPSTTAFVTAMNWPGLTVINSGQFAGK